MTSCPSRRPVIHSADPSVPVAPVIKTRMFLPLLYHSDVISAKGRLNRM